MKIDIREYIKVFLKWDNVYRFSFLGLCSNCDCVSSRYSIHQVLCFLKLARVWANEDSKARRSSKPENRTCVHLRIEEVLQKMFHKFLVVFTHWGKKNNIFFLFFFFVVLQLYLVLFHTDCRCLRVVTSVQETTVSSLFGQSSSSICFLDNLTCMHGMFLIPLAQTALLSLYRCSHLMSPSLFMAIFRISVCTRGARSLKPAP